MTNEVEIKVTMDDLTDRGYASVMAKIAKMKAALKDAGAAFEPTTNAGAIASSLMQMKQKMQSMGIADIADINQSPGTITSRLQLLKRLIQQAGISDLLDINSSASNMEAQISKLKAIVKANPLEIKVNYDYAPFHGGPLEWGAGLGPGGYHASQASDRNFWKGVGWMAPGVGPPDAGSGGFNNNLPGPGWLGMGGSGWKRPGQNGLLSLWNKWSPAGGGGGGGILGGLLGGGGSMFGGLAGIPGVGGALSGIGGVAGVPGLAGIAALAAAPVAIAGQAISGAIITGLGGALAGIGIYGAMQFRGARKDFRNFAADANDSLRQIGIPFRPAMEAIFKTADSTLKALTPVFQSATRTIAGPLQAFGTVFAASFNQPQVKSSIEAVASAFGKILQAVTPQLPGDIAQIARAIGEMANAIGQNPAAFATFGRLLTNLATWAIQGLAQLTRTANWMEKNWPTIWASLGIVLVDFAQLAVNTLKIASDAVFTFVGDTIHWARLAADAVGIHTFDGIDNGFNRIRGSADRFWGHMDNLLNGWRRNLLNAPQIYKLRGDITDLTGKLMTARAELNNPDLTKFRRAQIEANIDQLKAAIQQARAMLASINGTVAHTYISTNVIAPNSGKGFVGKASGGILGAGWTIAGEAGMPELIQAPGATVHSGPDTARMLSAGGGGTLNVILDVRGGEAEFNRMIRNWVHVDGGGNVQVAFGGSA